MHRQGSFYAGNWPPEAKVAEDGDVFAFYLPAQSAEGVKPVLGAGEFVAAFSDEPHVLAFQRYLSSRDYIQKRAELTPGSWVTAAKGVREGTYKSPIDQLSYDTLQNPEAVFRFDASDVMPAKVGAGSFWRGMTDWLAGAEPTTCSSASRSPGPRTSRSRDSCSPRRLGCSGHRSAGYGRPVRAPPRGPVTSTRRPCRCASTCTKDGPCEP